MAEDKGFWWGFSKIWEIFWDMITHPLRILTEMLNALDSHFLGAISGGFLFLATFIFSVLTLLKLYKYIKFKVWWKMKTRRWKSSQ